MKGYGWSNCCDFNVPESSVRCGEDDDGSIVYCGKAWCDGEEVPAKIVPKKRECRIKCGSGERIVPHCSKVLICDTSDDNESCNRKHHHHHEHHRDHHHEHHRDHHHERHCDHHHHDHHHKKQGDNCCKLSGGCTEIEETTTTKTETNNNNECKTFVQRVRVNSSTTTITVKKHKEIIEREPECWTEQRTRMVPKEISVPKVRYVPKVEMEKTVRYVPETYETVVCAEESCCQRRKSRCDSPCRDSCSTEEMCSEVECCDEGKKCKEEIVVKPKKCQTLPCGKSYC